MVCVSCRLDKPVNDFGITLGRNGKKYRSKKCKKCTNQMQHLRAKMEGTRAWAWRKHGKLKSKAISRGYSFELTIDDTHRLYSQPVCYYCEDVAVVRSVDRVNNSLGYTASNCVMACRECNILKRDILATQKNRLVKILAKL